MASRPITQPNTYGTIIGNAAMSLLDTSFNAVFSSGFNDSALGWVNYGVDTGTANNYTATLTQAPSTYTAGLTVALKIANSNTSTSTLNLNALGNKPIVNPANTALSGGELSANSVIPLVYDGTSFRIVGPCSTVVNLGNQSTTQTFNCAGYTNINLFVNFTVVSLGFILNNVSFGAFVTLVIQNLSGSTSQWSCNMTDPAANSLTVDAMVSGSTSSGLTAFNAVPVGWSNGSIALFRGTYLNSTTFLFSR